MVRSLTDPDRLAVISKPNPAARLRLFCFPFAGGSAAFFRSWADEFPPDLQLKTELCAIRFPGHEMRRSEALFTRLAPIVEALRPAVAAHASLPFAFFGHSMGALVSFELARDLRRRQMPGPVHLIVSGHRAPQLPDPHPALHRLPDVEFLAALRRYGGTPDAVLENSELIQLFMPVLRADFAVVETYAYKPELPLDCSISAFGGVEDPRVARDELAAWQEQTRDTFSLRMFPGDHFYLRALQTQFLQVLAQDLKQVVRRV
jgi:medium-chain acyl-[acyl-carrier-protein] hydrolase